jgi:hypothetical protein
VPDKPVIDAIFLSRCRQSPISAMIATTTTLEMASQKTSRQICRTWAAPTRLRANWRLAITGKQIDIRDVGQQLGVRRTRCPVAEPAVPKSTLAFELRVAIKLFTQAHH